MDELKTARKPSLLIVLNYLFLCISTSNTISDRLLNCDVSIVILYLNVKTTTTKKHEKQ